MSAEMDEDTLDERKISNGIRASAMLLPLLAIMWFLGVVALENASSIFFQIASASANIALVSSTLRNNNVLYSNHFLRKVSTLRKREKIFYELMAPNH